MVKWIPAPEPKHVCVLTSSLSQPMLTQQPFLSASLRTSAKFACTRSSGFDVDNFHIYWFQQKAGSPAQFLLRYKSDSDKYQGSRVRRHFSGSKETSTNSGILHISELQTEDKADYYCATWHQDSKIHVVIHTHGEMRHKLFSPGLCSHHCH